MKFLTKYSCTVEFRGLGAAGSKAILFSFTFYYQKSNTFSKINIAMMRLATPKTPHSSSSHIGCTKSGFLALYHIETLLHPPPPTSPTVHDFASFFQSRWQPSAPGSLHYRETPWYFQTSQHALFFSCYALKNT